MDLHLGPAQPAEPVSPEVLTVSLLTRRIRDLLEGGVGEVWVEGEISNHRRQASGHQYFTLKDESSQLACVVFARSAAGGSRLADGVMIEAFGAITVYEPRGQYQMIVRHVRERGEGALQAKFEALKKRLAAEGLFDAARKRALPKFPRRVGVVTSPTGAALRDFLHVLGRRQPGIEVIIHPVRVQGRGAADEIAAAVRDFSRPDFPDGHPVDVVVVTRGGGSLEDLWEFNEETVARAIAGSDIPVISAVGHEIDFTIADFAADVRAATPSAAAEMLSADRVEILDRIRRDAARLRRALETTCQMLRARLVRVAQAGAFREPTRRLGECGQSLDRLEAALAGAVALGVERARARLDAIRSRAEAVSPSAFLREAAMRNDHLARRLVDATQTAIVARRARWERCRAVVAAMDPAATVARGFTITRLRDGRVAVSVADIPPGTEMCTTFADGDIITRRGVDAVADAR